MRWIQKRISNCLLVPLSCERKKEIKERKVLKNAQFCQTMWHDMHTAQLDLIRARCVKTFYLNVSTVYIL